MIESAKAFAPASVANVAVGFDILGHAVQSLGDCVTARRSPQPGVRIQSIAGVTTDLPLDAANNTAGRAVLALWELNRAEGGVELHIEKGIPMSSGLGGSAASAVAAVVAANELLACPADKLTLLRCAMLGEQAASGSMHLDNIAPSLFGGLVLTVGIDNPRIKQIPVPRSIRCVFVHPHLRVATSDARALLRKTVSLSDFVWQSANLAGFICGCYTNDLEMIRDSLFDVVIEPQRQQLIPGFTVARASALANGALGCSISGAGPTVFAWCDARHAQQVRSAMVEAFGQHGLPCDDWVTSIEAKGARLSVQAASKVRARE